MATRKIKTKFIKAFDFRTSIISGVYGGITPNGLINATFFIDRTSLPDVQTFEIDEKDNVITQPIDEKESDFVREMPFSILMDLKTSKKVVEWLQVRIKEHEEKIKPTKP